MLKHIALVLAALACTAAHAADDFYKSPAQQGQTLTTKDVYRLEQSGPTVVMTVATGGVQYVNDPAGALIPRIVANQPEFIKIGNVYVNANHGAAISCSNGRSTFYLRNSAVTVSADDGCAGAQAAYNKAK